MEEDLSQSCKITVAQVAWRCLGIERFMGSNPGSTTLTSAFLVMTGVWSNRVLAKARTPSIASTQSYSGSLSAFLFRFLSFAKKDIRLYFRFLIDTQ